MIMLYEYGMTFVPERQTLLFCRRADEDSADGFKSHAHLKITGSKVQAAGKYLELGKRFVFELAFLPSSGGPVEVSVGLQDRIKAADCGEIPVQGQLNYHPDDALLTCYIRVPQADFDRIVERQSPDSLNVSVDVFMFEEIAQVDDLVRCLKQADGCPFPVTNWEVRLGYDFP